MKTKHGNLQDALIKDIHEAIDKHRVDVGDSLTFIEIIGCLEAVKLDMREEANEM